MTAESGLLRVAEQGQLQGFLPLLRREQRKWWGTWRWLLHTLVWLVALDGMLALSLFLFPKMQMLEGEPAIAGSPVDLALQIFFLLGTLFLSLATVVIMQDVVFREKEAGTAAWVLSKPVSRSAFLLSKLVANGFALLLTMVLLPGAVAYLLLELVEPGAVSLGAVAQAEAVVALNILFYVALTLLLGVVGKSRSVVLGVPLGVALVSGLGIIPWKAADVALSFVLGIDMGAVAPLMIGLIAISSIFLTGVALWAFGRSEF